MPGLKIDSNGKIPMVDVIVGHAQMGEYSLALWDDNESNPVSVGKGDSADDIEDRFRLVPTRDDLAALQDHTLSWVIFIKRLGRGRNQPYSFEIRITQDDEERVSVKKKGRLGSSLEIFDGEWKIELT